jgi:hypothetical protein
MMIVAFAGRRIDAQAARQHAFPLSCAAAVHQRLEALFIRDKPAALVSSAACGADLIALEVARTLSIRRRVVLPSEPAAFRESSVVDRPGNWGEIFDRTIGEVARGGDLVVKGDLPAGDEGYLAANRVIFDEAFQLASSVPGGEVAAVVVWEGPRPDADATREFAEEARRRGIVVLEVPTVAD